MSKEDIIFIIAISFFIAWGIVKIIWFIKLFLKDD